MRKMQEAREVIKGVTIAPNGTVNYDGVRTNENGTKERFHISTSMRRRFFNWSSVPKGTVVIDAEGFDRVKAWHVLMSYDHPSFSAKLQACRNVGMRTTTVAQIMKEVRAAS